MAIPFPAVLAEIFLFFFLISNWGIWNTLAFYFLPCILGFFIVNIWSRITIPAFQAAALSGQKPGFKLMNSAAIFLSGLCFLVPSFFLRVLGVLLLLPGTRHFLVWKFKEKMAARFAGGRAGGFNFGNFQFRTGGFPGGGFPGAGGFPPGADPFGRPQQPTEERDVTASNAVLDVKPLEVTHTNTDKKDS